MSRLEVDLYLDAWRAIYPDSPVPVITRRGSWYRVTWPNGSVTYRAYELRQMSAALNERRRQYLHDGAAPGVAGQWGRG